MLLRLAMAAASRVPAPTRPLPDPRDGITRPRRGQATRSATATGSRTAGHLKSKIGEFTVRFDSHETVGRRTAGTRRSELTGGTTIALAVEAGAGVGSARLAEVISTGTSPVAGGTMTVAIEIGRGVASGRGRATTASEGGTIDESVPLDFVSRLS